MCKTAACLNSNHSCKIKDWSPLQLSRNEVACSLFPFCVLLSLLPWHWLIRLKIKGIWLMRKQPCYKKFQTCISGKGKLRPMPAATFQPVDSALLRVQTILPCQQNFKPAIQGSKSWDQCQSQSGVHDQWSNILSGSVSIIVSTFIWSPLYNTPWPPATNMFRLFALAAMAVANKTIRTSTEQQLYMANYVVL